MKKTLREIVNSTGSELRCSAGDLEMPPYCPLIRQKRVSKPETKEYITCFCFLKNAQYTLYNLFNNLKFKIMQISNYIPKII